MNEALTILTGIGLGGIIVTLINGLFSKRKLSADATKIITEAASGVVQNLRDENVRVMQSNAQLTARVESTEDRQRQMIEHQRQLDSAIAVHAFWDRQAFNAARAQGIDLPEPPPLPIGGA